MAVKHITQNVIRGLKTPVSGNVVVWDDEVVGFGVRITAAGAVAFVLRYIVNGRERRITIGKYPDWSATAAREEAARLRGDVSRGGDPLSDRERRFKAPTVADLAQRYLDKHAKPHKRASSVRDDTSMIERTIKPRFGSRKVAAISHGDIEDLHQSLAATPYAANRTLALLSKMFALAITWGARPDNPCKGVKRFREQSRKSYLKPDELQRLLHALNEHPNKQTANAVRLLLMTGARRGEVLSATWDQFDLEAGEWTKPAAFTKQKATHHLPLSAPALALLASLKASQTNETYLFPSREGDTPQQDLKRFWRSICKSAGLGRMVEKRTKAGKPVLSKNGELVHIWEASVRVHDLRHSFASYLASGGASLPLIGEMLGHTQASTTQRYAHLLDDPKRKAAETVGAIISAAAGQTTGAEVVPIRKRRK